MSYIPDNYDAFVSRENELERLERLHKRFEKELEEIENERFTSNSEPTGRDY